MYCFWNNAAKDIDKANEAFQSHLPVLTDFLQRLTAVALHMPENLPDSLRGKPFGKWGLIFEVDQEFGDILIFGKVQFLSKS